jgi:putative transposase
MAIPSRHGSVAGTYFVTSRTWESRALFVTESFCSVFVEALLHYRDNGAYTLHDFVLMPDHFHVLLTPAGDKALERVVQYIKGGSARQLAIAKAMRFPVWQRGFSDHRIRDLADFETHKRYIWQNPVRKKLVLEAPEFRWSSASGRYAMDAAPQGAKAPESNGEDDDAARLKPCPDERKDSERKRGDVARLKLMPRRIRKHEIRGRRVRREEFELKG